MQSASTALADLTATLTARGAITAEDVLAMRRLVWGDATVGQDEAEAIMALNSACTIRSREWLDYFVEVMTDYLVRQRAPVGYVDDAKAEWLTHWIDSDGRVDSLGELELLVRILEVADDVPASLKTYALKQVEQAVMTGEGPTRDGGTLDAACINASEVELLRRIIFAEAGDGAYIVSADEAEALFRIKDATLKGDNATTWQDMFVKAVANHLMAHRNYQTLSRADKAQLDAYAADTHVSLGRFFGRMVHVNTPRLSEDALAIADEMNDEAAAAVDHALTPAEIDWVLAEIRADGKYDPLEKALVAFLRKEMARV